MRYSLLAAELLLASTAHAVLEIPVAKRDRHTNGRTAERARGLTRRAGTLETTLFSGIGFVSGGAYYANITVGTPPQQLTVLLDTGSSDLYLDVASDCPSSSSKHPCLGGTFVPGNSKTIDILPGNTAFNATYGDGSRAIGPYATDVVCINDVCIDNVQFGLAETIDATVGPATSLMGIGSWVIEAADPRDKYPNIPWVLADAGVINSRLFSLYLDNYDDLTGSILFGGIDKDKYTGDLVTTDTLVDPVTREVDQFITAITALKVTVSGNTDTIFSGGETGAAAYKSGSPSLPVLLDSGSSAWSVPQQYYEAIVSKFTYVDPRTSFGSCKYASSGDSVTLTINGAVDITVDISNFYLPLFGQDGQPEYISEGEQACGFEIVPSEGTGEGFQVMGDAMLRSMYVVYDLDLGQMSIAQSNPGSTSSNIVAVQAGQGGVAKAAGSSGKNAPANSYSIAPSISVSDVFTVSTANSAVGTATGISAIPTAARVSGEAQFSGVTGTGSSGGSSSGSSPSKGAAPAVIPAVRWAGLGPAAMVAAFMCFGAALVL